MTKDEIQGYILQFLRLGDLLIVFVPDVLLAKRFLAYLRALSVSDELLTELAVDISRLFPVGALASTADVKLSLQSHDGTIEELGPAGIFLFMKLLKMFLTFINKD